jgi:bifunctional isochorismate lyase/aryl carrier protein
MAIPKLNAYALPTAADLPNNKVYWAFEPERAALLIHDMQELVVFITPRLVAIR